MFKQVGKEEQESCVLIDNLQTKVQEKKVKLHIFDQSLQNETKEGGPTLWLNNFNT